MEHQVTGKQYNSKNCIICGVDNDLGLKVRFYETSSNELVAIFTPREEHQSYPNRMHGGMSCAVLDETIGRAVAIGSEKMIWGVTTEITMKYRRPVPLGQELKAIGRITYHKGRFFEGEGELLLPDGKVAVTAKAKYMVVPEEKMVDGIFLDEEWGLDLPADDPDTIEY